MANILYFSRSSRDEPAIRNEIEVGSVGDRFAPTGDKVTIVTSVPEGGYALEKCGPYDFSFVEFKLSSRMTRVDPAITFVKALKKINPKLPVGVLTFDAPHIVATYFKNNARIDITNRVYEPLPLKRALESMKRLAEPSREQRETTPQAGQPKPA